MVDVTIAGGGASGVLLAAHLLAHSPETRVIVFEPGELGLGVAYATTCPAHQLNVPAAKMSAFPEDPSHFLTWLETRYPGRYHARSFAPRSVYGAYLHDIAVKTAAQYGERFVHRREMLSDPCDAAGVLVLATGNAAPARWPGAPDDERFFASAWQRGALVPTTPHERVLILGTGLTAVDAVLGLRYNGHRGPISLVSRRGLLPHEHRLFDAPLEEPNPESQTLAAFVRNLRQRASSNWRAAIDGVRPRTNDLWRALTFSERRRFLRHVVPYWNVHRHRMAPEAAAAMAELVASGAVVAIAARTSRFESIAGGMRVTLRERGSEHARTLEVERVINCSGPEHDIAKLTSPLIQQLRAQGTLVAGGSNVGIDVASDGALIGIDGEPSKTAFAIGPVRFGTLIETTAIPEIREQARTLARTLR